LYIFIDDADPNDKIEDLLKVANTSRLPRCTFQDSRGQTNVMLLSTRDFLNVSRKAVFIVLLMFCFACKNDEVVGPLSLLTVTVDPSFLTSTTDNWIIISDENGSPLTYKSFESGEVQRFETNLPVPGNTIGVTLLKYTEQYGGKHYTADTYFQYSKGGDLTLSASVDQAPPLGPGTGEFDVTVNSVTPIHQYSVMNKFAIGMTGSQHNEPDFNFTGYLYADASKYLLQASTQSGDVRYKMLSNIQPDDSFTFSFDELSEFDKTAEFSFPESKNVVFIIQGREQNQPIDGPGYLTHFHLDYDPHTHIKGGYLNSLTKYKTILNASYTQAEAGTRYELSYYNKGSVPEGRSLTLFPDDYHIYSRDIRDFSATSDNPFIYRKTFFQYTDPSSGITFSWFVNSPSGDHKLSELPAEIVGSRPVLKIDKLSHVSTTFYVESLPYLQAILPDVQNENYILRGITLW